MTNTFLSSGLNVPIHASNAVSRRQRSGDFPEAQFVRAWARTLIALGLFLLLVLGTSALSLAQVSSPPATTPLTLEKAVQVALGENYQLRRDQLARDAANAQIREARGRLLPHLSIRSNYQRNVVTANPFAGSSAGNIFGSLGSIDWLQYNEQARVDNNPATQPISLSEFRQRQQAGYQEIGVSPGNEGNPFSVANQFNSGIEVTQTLFSQSAFTALESAEQVRELRRTGLQHSEQEVVHRTRTAFYDVLLAEARVDVLEQSVERAKESARDARARVDRGVASRYHRLSAEVQVSNTETALIQARNQAASARDRLKQLTGLDVNQEIAIRGSLSADLVEMPPDFSPTAATERALDQRLDLKQAALSVELEKLRVENSRASYLPNVSAFANLDYSGRVPSDRVQVVNQPGDPFSYQRQEYGFFDDSYWNPNVAVGVQVSWNLFTGFQNQARIQQAQLSVRQAEVQLEERRQAVQKDVQEAVRGLQNARERIASQEKNLERARLNYSYATRRLQEGTGSPVEQREASEQLDQARLNHLQAVRDYLQAASGLELALGSVSRAQPSLSTLSGRSNP